MTTPRVTVLGATGKIAHHVVDQLLARGHEVTALVRTPAKLTTSHPSLTVQVGRLSDVDAARTAASGSDVVISALGPSLGCGGQGTPLTDGLRTVVAAMRQAGVRRFVGLATPSIADGTTGPPSRPRSCRSWPS